MPETNCPSREELSAYALGKLQPKALEVFSEHIDDCSVCQTALATLDEAEDTLVARLRSPMEDDQYLKEPQCREALERAKVAAAEPVLATPPPLSSAEPLPAAGPDDGSGREPASRQAASPSADGSSADADSPDVSTPATADGSLRVPRRLGEYQLIEKLGQGGMGAVFKAQHTKLRRVVALKVLARGATPNERAVARFEREMAAVGRLNHPNVVQAHDAREVAGLRFLVMEFVEGLDLSELVKHEGPLPIADACELIRQAALGLQAAHEHELVHRDVKPSNLMLTRQGQVKVLDLGLARIRSDLPNLEEVTDTGQVMGTADYIAPEQATDSHAVDIRADIYSLGCTLYKLLSGRAPFAGADYQNTIKKMMAHVQEPVPPIRQLRGDVPELLAELLSRMLAKDPRQRFSTPAELADAIGRFTAGSDLSALLARAEDRPKPPIRKARARASTHDQLSAPKIDTQVGYRARPLPLLERLPRRFRTRRAAAVALATVAVLLAAAIFIRIATDNGELVLDIADPQTEVILEQGSQLVLKRNGTEAYRFEWQEGNNRFRVRSGKYELELAHAGNVKLRVEPTSIMIHRGAKPVVKVLRTPSEPPGPPGLSGPPLAVAPFDAKQARRHQQAWADHLGVPVEFTNSIGMKFVLIPPGEFAMGSSKAERKAALGKVTVANRKWVAEQISRVSSEVQHRVKITKPFYLGKYEATQAQWEAVMGNNPAKSKCPTNPVEEVSWYEIQEFLSKLPAASGRKDVAHALPTEAQWEYACRAGTATAFCCGDNAAILGEYGWLKDNSGGKRHSAGQRKPNAWGLHDMHGNVWECCADWYGVKYYLKSPPNDPTGPATGAFRVRRGGGSHNYPADCRSATRNYAKPGDRIWDQGFRVVCPVEGAAKATSPLPRPAAAISTVTDPEGNLDGDESRTFVDILEASVELREDYYVFTIDVAGDPKEAGKTSGGKHFRYFFYFDTDRDSMTGRGGNEYQLDIQCKRHKWYAGFSRVTEQRTWTQVESGRASKETYVTAGKGTVTARLPAKYFPSRHFDWVASCTVWGKEWGTGTKNPPTMRKTFNAAAPESSRVKKAPAGKQPAAKSWPISILGDAEGNDGPGRSRPFVDIVKGTVELRDDQYIFTVETAEPLPRPEEVGCHNYGFFFNLDVDQNSKTGFTDRGEDYAVAIWVHKTGPEGKVDVSRPPNHRSHVRIDAGRARVEIKGNIVSLSLPAELLPEKRFHWWMHSKAWGHVKPDGGNPITARALFDATEAGADP